MFAGFSEFNVAVKHDINIYGIQAGSGPPLLLLHGFPQTHHIWHRVAEELAAKYTVVIPDLRGYGQSSKPAGGEGHQDYAKSTMAQDCVRLMTQRGFEKFYLCGHDRGARVSHKLCVDYPDVVNKVILLDICPTLSMFNQTDKLFATVYFHWFFLIQPAPFPETLMSSNPEVFAKKFFSGAYGSQGSLKIFDKECLDIYTKMIGQEDAAHAMCEDYRAAATTDLIEARDDIAAGRKIQCPVRVLWGYHGLIERCYDAIKEWKNVSSSEVDGECLHCGHYIPEEAPEALLKHMIEFFI